MLEDGGHEDGLDLLLHQLCHALVDPDGDVGEHAAVLREVKIPQALLDLLLGAPGLELLLARVLLEVVEDAEHVREPQRLDLEVVEAALLDDLLDERDGPLDQRPHRVLVVHVISVPVGRKGGEMSGENTVL